MVQFTCAKCASVFEAPEIGGGGYGGFLLRSASGETAYLNAIQDQVYEEVDQLLAVCPETSNMRSLERAKVLQRIFGEVACDKASDGSSFVLGAHPPCPKCGSQEMAAWEFKTPTELVDVQVAPVTHMGWSQLSPAEKQGRVEEKLASR